MDHLEQLRTWLSSKGFDVEPVLDGEYHRFDRHSQGSGFFVGSVIPWQNKNRVLACVGDWATNEKLSYKSDEDAAESGEEAQAFTAHLQQLWAQAAEAKKKYQAEIAENVAVLWPTLPIASSSHDYLSKKRVDAFNLRLDSYGNLCVPMYDYRDGADVMVGMQRISPMGNKNFMRGQQVAGCYNILGECKNDGTIYFAEGYSTAASIHQATKEATVIAFNANNLAKVATSFRARYSSARFVVCADNDQFTLRNGEPYNTGLEAAREACRQTGATLRVPTFSDLSSKPTDFNDLHCLNDLDTVRAQLTQHIGTVETVVSERGSGFQGLEPMTVTMGRGGVPKFPPHKEICNRLLEHLGGNLIRRGEDVWEYTGKHWKLHTDADKMHIYSLIQYLLQNYATLSQIEAIYGLFLTELKLVPDTINPFLAQRNCINFQNGTLWIERSGLDHSFRLVMKPHNPHDFVFNLLPWEMGDPDDPYEGADFEAMLDRIIGSTDRNHPKRLAIQEAFASCLCPIMPHLWLLHGPQATGKSTLIILMQRLVSKENWGAAEPSQFKGFLMQQLLGKLVNIVSDIDTTAPINDGNLKKIEDQIPMLIDRKFKEPIIAPLPMTHIFGANGIPPTLDGSSGAHERRWTFIELGIDQRGQGLYIKDYANWIFEKDPKAVLMFAVRGLKRLLANRGHFTIPEESKATMKEWELEADPVGTFLEQVKAGEIVDQNSKIGIRADFKIERPKLWEVYRTWSENSFGRDSRLHRTKFFSQLRGKNFVEYKSDGVLYFKGIGLIESGSDV